MRIVGGIYGSRLISMPKGADIRPTQDKVRQAIFNILGDISGANVLDLFAGSGAFGMEAISRGATHATFVDSNARCLATIRLNLESLAIPESRYSIIKSSALTALPALKKEGKKFDLVFLDPPYYKDMAKICLINLDSCDILTRTCRIIAEHFKKDSLEADFERLVSEKERVYGDTVISIFKVS